MSGVTPKGFLIALTAAALLASHPARAADEAADRR